MSIRFADCLDRIRFRYRREICRRIARRLHRFALARPMISFTFDDFPRNAATTGGSILKQFGLSATYYLSLGLAGTVAPTGPIFEPDDLHDLVADGHELGCHTFDHRHAWDTDSRTFAAALDRNQKEVRGLFPELTFTTMSYPISCPSPGVKKVAAKRFAVCRGGGQTFNSRILDRNYVKAFFLEKSRETPAVVREIIDRTCKANGWLILATHDIADRPTPYGCTPRYFEDIVRYAANSGASILPVAKAWGAICSQDSKPDRSNLSEQSLRQGS